MHTNSYTGPRLDTILDVLAMKDPSFVSESPNKQNMVYVVECISKGSNLEDYFAWLAEDIYNQAWNNDRKNNYILSNNQKVW